MQKIQHILLLGSLALLQSMNAAVLISAVGDGTGYDITGTEASGYRSTNIAKAFDVDGDDAYGTAGYLAFGDAGGSDGGEDYPTYSVESAPAFVTGGFTIDTANTTTVKNTGYLDIDNPTLAIGADVENFGSTAVLIQNQSGINSGDWCETLSFSIDAAAPSFRLGVLAGATTNTNFDPAGFRLSFSEGASDEVTTIVGNAAEIGAVFFDVTVTDGTTGTFALETLEGSSNSAITAVTFDVHSNEVVTSAITYDFDDGDGVVDTNDFGLGVTAGDWTFDVDDGGSGFQSGRAEVGVRTDGGSPTPYPIMRFDVTIPAGVTVDLTGLSFDHGFNEVSHVNGITPYWELAISTGSASPNTNTLGTGTVDVAGHFAQSESLNLSGLTGLTDTTVTFEFTFRTDENRNNDLDRAHTVDNVVLLGTVESFTPVPVISVFAVDDLVVDSGETVTLYWDVDGADTLSIDQAVGSVSPVDVGSAGVVVDSDTTYTLTATNVYGTVSAEVFVRVRLNVPNILLVVVDDMGTEDTSVDFNYDALGAVLDPIDPVTVGLPVWPENPSDDPTNDPGGNAHFRTPAMETLASNGMKFSRAYAMQVCSPARRSLLTGQNAARHGTIQWLGRRNDNLHNLRFPSNRSMQASDRTLAEVFRDSGYRTIIAGKGHIGGNFNSNAGIYTTPSANQSDDYFGFQINISAGEGGAHGDCYSDGSGTGDSTAFGLSASGTTAGLVAEYQDMTYHELDPLTYPSNHAVANEPVYVTEAITREMIERIETCVDESVPFFAFMSHFAVHAPHDTDPRFTGNYPQFSSVDDYLPLAYATMIEGMDQSLADVLLKLEALGVAEDTLVVFTSDNGSDYRPRGPQEPPTLAGGNPLRGEKGNRYEGGLRVPLIVSWAKRDASNSFQQALTIPAASRDDTIVVLQDLYPTLLSIAGIPLPTVDDNGDPLTLDGYDISSVFRGTPGSHLRETLINHAPASSRSSYFTTFHDGDYKLIYNYTQSSPLSNTNVPLGTYELYNLATDPYEAANLVNSDPQRVMNMARDMIGELETMGAPYPILRNSDSDLLAIGMPASAGDVHPVILPDMPTVDVDNDGLADNTEDPNRNGLVDAGETAPDNDNSDGDNIIDGDEVALGLDPLDPGSYFYVSGTPDPASPFTLTWPSLPGTNFEIRGSADLVDWSEIIAPDVPADELGSSTSYEISPSAEPRKFYRVGLK
ncbi:MAG: sulfatase-like hydrolase/transferase [Opitutaceae bacterium]